MGSARHGAKRGSATGPTPVDAPGILIQPFFWVSNEGIENGHWTIHVKIMTATNKIRAIGGTFPLDKTSVKLDIYHQQAKTLNPKAAAFFKEIADAYMETDEYRLQVRALPKE
jgi:hypothetical protein